MLVNVDKLEKNEPPPAKNGRVHVAALPDAQNPRERWSTFTKYFVTILLCTWILTLTYASTAYVASIAEIQQHFGVSRTYALGGTVVFVLGFSAAPLLFGPASDLYGRRPVYVVSGVLYSAAMFGAAFAPSAPSLLAFRFLSAFFGSASINNVIASISDYTYPAERMWHNAYYALYSFLGPAFGPLCGVFIERYAGFRWNLRVMAIFATVFSIISALVPETHGPTLARQAEQARGNHVKVTRQQAIQAFRIALSRPMLYMFTEPLVGLVCIFLSTLYAILYGFFGCFSYVYIDLRGFSNVQYGLTYISLAAGFFFSFSVLQTLNYYDARKSAHLTDKARYIAPETRLRLSYPSAVVAPISLVIFAWTAPYPNVHWIAPCIGEFLFSASLFGMFMSFVPYLAECYLSYTASALAAGMFSRAFVASVFPLFTQQMYEKMTVQGGTMFFAALLAVLAPMPFFFRAHGAQLRAASSIAVHDPDQ